MLDIRGVRHQPPIHATISAMESIDVAIAAAEWCGYELDDAARERLEAYALWLEAEAIPAGGLGPREGDRLWTRHIGDSLVFAAGWQNAAPSEILDVGTGVGLPGIPLAILWPDCEVTLLDRGGRRIRLLQRIVRILGLENVAVFQGDAFDVADEFTGVVYRGSVTAPESVGLSAKLLDIPGTAVLGLSRRPEPPDRSRDLIGVATALGLDAEVLGVPPTILDGAAWLLIMRSGEEVS
jgi:16S rRNA (guanine527-N7)-methyltransferase